MGNLKTKLKLAQRLHTLTIWRKANSRVIRKRCNFIKNNLNKNETKQKSSTTTKTFLASLII